jgi:microcystin-dependent protein
MSLPFTPADAKALISDPTSSLCGNFIKTLLRLPVLFYQLVSYLVDENGDPTGVVSTGDFIFSAVNTGDTTGRLLCDGSAKSTTTYANLYAAIGDVYATTNGQAAPSAGLFRVPDCRARFPAGIGTFPSATSIALGDEGGEEKHQLTIAEGAFDTAHVHTVGRMREDSGVAGDDVYLLTGTSDKDGDARSIYGEDTARSGLLSGRTGEYLVTSDANVLLDPADIAEHSNLPPYFAAYVYIKT